MKEFKITGFCYGNNHQRCYFMREMPNRSKFCGLWMRTIVGVPNQRKQGFKCTFCNASTITVKSVAGPTFVENPPEVDNGSRTISN